MTEESLRQYYAVIMAGGGGTRLWPLSRQARPKQMLELVGEGSMFQIAVDRLKGLFPPERILVVTSAEQAAQLQPQAPEIPAQNFVVEPGPRDTAAAIGLAAVAIQHRDPQAVMAVLTADHYIGNVEHFLNLLRAAKVVAGEGYLVTLGIEPDYPATGYGYIQSGELIGTYQDLDAYRVVRFREKPDEDNAKKMIAGGDHAWNSGMFVWRVERVMEEFASQMPALSAVLEEIAAAWGAPDQSEVTQRVWFDLEKKSIDFGIMEGAQQVAVLPAKDLAWSDIGSWDALFDVLPQNGSGNVILGENQYALDTNNSLLYLKESERLVVTIGLEDIVIVDTGDVLLVCKKDQAQKVRLIIQHLKESQGQKYI